MHTGKNSPNYTDTVMGLSLTVKKNKNSSLASCKHYISRAESNALQQRVKKNIFKSRTKVTVTALQQIHYVILVAPSEKGAINTGKASRQETKAAGMAQQPLRKYRVTQIFS